MATTRVFTGRGLMFVQFSFDAASQQEAGALGATWIAAALEVADSEAWQTVLDGPTPVLYELLPPDQPLTSPHSYCAALTSVYESAPGSFKLRARSRDLTAAGIARVVAKPAASCISVSAKILKTDDQGYPIMGPGGPGGTATVRFQGYGNSTGVLGMNFNEHDTDQVRRVLALTREYVSDVDVSSE